MKFFTEELWKGINGISLVYDIENAELEFQRNIQKYNEIFYKETVHFLTKETAKLYEKYGGFHDMEILKLQYEQGNFYIYGRTVHIAFVDVKELRGNAINRVDALGYMEIFYRKETEDFQIGILFSWEDSVYVTCSNIVAKEGPFR